MDRTFLEPSLQVRMAKRCLRIEGTFEANNAPPSTGLHDLPYLADPCVGSGTLQVRELPALELLFETRYVPNMWYSILSRKADLARECLKAAVIR